MIEVYVVYGDCVRYDDTPVIIGIDVGERFRFAVETIDRSNADVCSIVDEDDWYRFRYVNAQVYGGAVPREGAVVYNREGVYV